MRREAGLTLLAANLAFPFHQALEGVRARALETARASVQEARLLELLGPLDVWLRAPSLDADAMAAVVRDGLGSGRFDGLVLGESHSVRDEIAFGERVVAEHAPRLARFLKERNTFRDTSALRAAGVPVEVFPNQFKPVAEVERALRRSRGRPVATYTGHAHTADRLKDYLLYTLREGERFGYGPGGKDMPTVEDGFRAAGARPLIVAMATEARFLRRVESMLLRERMDDAPRAPVLLARVEALLDVWTRVLARYPRRSALYFVRDADSDLYLGLTPAAKTPMDALATRELLRDAAFADWAGDSRLRLVESLWGSAPGPDGAPVITRTVVAHALSGETFTRVYADDDLVAAAGPPTEALLWGAGFRSKR